MRQAIVLFVVVYCGVFLCACTTTTPIKDDFYFTAQTTPYRSCDEAFSVPFDQVDLYYQDHQVLPYVTIRDYLDMIQLVSRLSDSTMMVQNDTVIIEYTPIVNQYLFFAREETAYSSNDTEQIVFDFLNDTITVSSYLFFMFQGIPLAEEMSDHITISDVEYSHGESITIPLRTYGFELFVQEEDDQTRYLVPFHVLSLLFTNSTMYRTYYNGDDIVLGGRCIYEAESRQSTLNGQSIPTEIKMASYQLFALSLDYFSPIKEIREISSYQSLLNDELEAILSADGDAYYDQLTQMLYQVDDLHADLPSSGYYAPSPAQNNGGKSEWYQPIRQSYLDAWNVYIPLFQEYVSHQQLQSNVELIENDTIAIVYLFQFTEDSKIAVQSALDSLPNTVQDVVIDVTMNGGGKVRSIFHVLGLMTDDPITFHNGIALDGSSVSFTVEIDEQAYPYNWYIRTSTLTFSAANAFALVAKDNSIATIIGEDTSGGASAIESVILPCGYSYTISGNYSFYINHQTSERGLPVSHTLTPLWNSEQVIQIVH